jgi:hypothetical protein
MRSALARSKKCTSTRRYGQWRREQELSGPAEGLREAEGLALDLEGSAEARRTVWTVPEIDRHAVGMDRAVFELTGSGEQARIAVGVDDSVMVPDLRVPQMVPDDTWSVTLAVGKFVFPIFDKEDRERPKKAWVELIEGGPIVLRSIRYSNRPGEPPRGAFLAGADFTGGIAVGATVYSASGQAKPSWQESFVELDESERVHLAFIIAGDKGRAAEVLLDHCSSSRPEALNGACSLLSIRLDGVQVCRDLDPGAADFVTDRLPLGKIDPGQHTLTVTVQSAPSRYWLQRIQIRASPTR